MESFRAVIGHYSRVALARDLGVAYGVVKQWDRRDSIPAEYWQDIVEGAKSRGLRGVSLEMLAKLARARVVLPVDAD